MAGLQKNVLTLLEDRFSSITSFWRTGQVQDVFSIEQHCDVVYSLTLLNEQSSIHGMAVEKFIARLKQTALPGWSGGEGRPLSVHNCAYAFGALNLLSHAGFKGLYTQALEERAFQSTGLVDRKGAPLYPRWLGHHNWRVSHWIGGTPSILWSLGQSDLADAPTYAALATSVLEVANAQLDSKTGLLHLYRSEAGQRLFRFLYSRRHDPELGDIGGVAHLLWVNHVAGRPYVACQALLDQSRNLFERHTPFMEGVPYCLDFDVVQIVRTGLEQTDDRRGADVARAKVMMADIETFFSEPVPETYNLHKIPGALATYHECALIVGKDAEADLRMPVFDIIKRAYWL